MLHNDVEIRTQIGVSENSTAWLDMDIKDYNGLPSMSVDIENPNQPIL